MRGHGDKCPDRDNTRAADACDQEVIGTIKGRDRGVRQSRGQGLKVYGCLAGLTTHRTFQGHEGRAEPVGAGKILIAGRLVDAPLRAELGFDRLDGQAVGFHRAVTAAFTDKLVDNNDPGRIGHRATLATAALFRCACLLVDQHGYAVDIAQFPLHGVKIATMVNGCARRKRGGRELLRLITDERDALHALGPHLVCDRLDAHRAIHRLPAGHRHRIVVEDLVGDVRTRSDRLSDRHRT